MATASALSLLKHRGREGNQTGKGRELSLPVWSRRVGDPILDVGRNQLAGVEAGRLGD